MGFRLRSAMLGRWLSGMELLQDMFLSVNNKMGGFERRLKNGSYSSHGEPRYYHKTDRVIYDGTRGTTTTPKKRNGNEERFRRLRQINRRGKLLEVENIGPGSLKGATAIAWPTLNGTSIDIQFDDLHRPHSHGWHKYPASEWALR